MTKITMPNFSSISLTNTKVKYIFFVLAYGITFALYGKSFMGHPIWDDLTHWFYDPIMAPTFPYSAIWKNFTWPLSVSLQKFLFGMAKENWWVYHSLNLVLHGFNSWLVYRLLRLLKLRISYAFLGFLFFLIHPASVVTVAWMIQLKTLLCFTFTIGALILFIRAKRKRDYVIANVLFFLSVLSKSASIPFPLVLFFFLGKSWKTKKTLTILPFILTSGFGIYQLTHSQLAVEAIGRATKIATAEINPKEMEKKKQNDVMFRPISDEPLINPSVDYAPVKLVSDYLSSWGTSETLSPIRNYARLMIKTLYYYFWQAYLPMNNAPVKGLNPLPPEFHDYLHLVFLFVISFLLWGTNLFAMLISAHLFLLPYLGIVPAPYMNVTWVSDQHLYLALPCFILLLFGAIEKINIRWMNIPLIILLFFYSFKTFEASSYYKNNFSFYEASIESNYNNIPLVYNLSILYIANGEPEKASDLLATIIQLADVESHLKENQYYPFLVSLYTRLSLPGLNP